ncbi:hypothetical protein OZX74_04695 [Bifidobacterium sp. ESL0798]|uniref:hypothetical protein n=1 Tax=Bifidobacterium sp. ESL0798 TaxID=2983235 RepID=UPI0023FA10B3|nr:hypothetical protein [Bifidobacterium sp. ESL0798]WEV74805.1 hypothetical protein OZX74_04695 [Bifidobacterium sp. ESL0798]
MNARTHNRHRTAIRIVAATVITAMILACLAAWWQFFAPLPIKHRAHADIITQTQALYDSDPYHVQQAVKRAQGSNIVIRASDDPGNHRIQAISVKFHGLYWLIDEPAHYDNPPSDTHGETIMVWISRKPFTDSFDPDSAVIVNNKDITALDTKEFPRSTDKLHMTQKAHQGTGAPSCVGDN